jgi:CMP-N-acetylneuraminic acid synthetase
MKAVAFIFARSGSKGLPGKNTQLFSGKPLIAWAIERALAVNRISRVIVSTDSEEIATISREFGAEVPFIRPPELATDDSPEWLSWRHGLEYLQATEGELPDVMVSVPTVAPLGLASDIENCLNEYETGKFDVVITISEASHSPYFNMVEVNSEGTLELVITSKSNIVRRQDGPKVFDIATVCYVVNSAYVMSQDSIFKGRLGGVCVPAERAIDIDTELDFKIAEFLKNRNLQNDIEKK